MPKYVVLKKLNNEKVAPVTNITAVQGLRAELDERITSDVVTGNIEAISVLSNYYTKDEINSLINTGGSGGGGVIIDSALSGSSMNPVQNKVIKVVLDNKQDVISDLSTIRSNAQLATSALQSFTETDPTVPAWAKQVNKPSYTATEVGALPSDTTIPSALSDLTDDSTHRVVTDNEKTTWSGKQDALVSGTNIKTINGTSLLGSGDISISGGSSITVDSALLNTSENPVQNKVIYNALENKQNVINSNNKLDYSLIDNAPLIPAAQIQVDFNQSDNTALDYIKNKPDLSTKQDTLVSGTNIKTINNQSILGNGNINVSSSSGDTNIIEIVKINGTALTPDNDKAVNVIVPTQLSDLTDDASHRLVTDTEKGTWNNKYDKPANGIPASDLESGVIPTIPTNVSAFTNDANYLTQHQDITSKQDVITAQNKLDYSLIDNTPTIPDITGKADKVSGGTTDNFAALDANGNLKDSGHKHSDYLTSHQDISGKADKTTITTSSASTGSITLTDNNEYRFTASALTSLAIDLPVSIGDNLDCWIAFNSGSTATSTTYPNTIKWSGDDVSNNVFVPLASKTYNIGIWYDGINVNAVTRGV